MNGISDSFNQTRIVKSNASYSNNQNVFDYCGKYVNKPGVDQHSFPLKMVSSNFVLSVHTVQDKMKYETKYMKLG